MSEVREALQAILRVNFREPIPATDQLKIGNFLERAAQEILDREERVSDREVKVSQREANAELRATEATQQIEAIASFGRVRKILDLTPRRRRWFGLQKAA